MLIYPAGPLFSEAERTFNDSLTGKLERLGFDVFLFVLDGRVPDEGACVELGIAHAHRNLTEARRLLVGLHTDDRAAFLTSKPNPMLRVPLDLVAEDEEALTETLKEYRVGRDVRPPAAPRSSR